MPKPEHLQFFIDPNRCIGCQACVQACTECDTHRGESMIHLEYVERESSVQTVPVVCMHCEQPTCAECARPMRSSGQRTVSYSRRASRAVSPAVTASSHVLSAYRKCRRPQDHDEVRHALRPIERWQEADVRDRVPESGFVLRDARAD